MRIEEKTVRSPRERLGAPIHMLVRWCLGQVATIFFLEVLLMFCVFCLDIAYPGNDGDSCSQRWKPVNHDLSGAHHDVLPGMQTKRLTGILANEHHGVRNNTHLILRQSAVVPTGGSSQFGLWVAEPI